MYSNQTETDNIENLIIKELPLFPAFLCLRRWFQLWVTMWLDNGGVTSLTPDMSAPSHNVFLMGQKC